MISPLSKFGYPVQAQTVPAIIERLAESQMHMITALWETTFGFSMRHVQATYHRDQKADAEGGIPSYYVIARHTIHGLHSEDKLDRPLNLLKARFGENVETVIHLNDFRVPVAVEWCLKISPSIQEKFQSQELPTFSDNQSDTFGKVVIHLKEPMFAYDFALFREKVEASCAVALAEQPDDHTLILAIPGKRDLGIFEEESERWAYVEKLLREWHPTAYLGKETQSYSSDALKQLEGLFLDLQQPASEPPFSIQPAKRAFIEQVVGRGIKPAYQVEGVGTLETCKRVFGEPGKHYANALWSYFFQLGESLAVIEGKGDNVHLVYAFPGLDKSARHFESFLNLIK